MLLYNFNLKKFEKLDAIRDLFCFGCFTGMRLSDILALSHENVHEDKILFRVEKTEQSNFIPLNSYTKAILKKYAKKFPNKSLPTYSEGFINEQLKELFKKVEINRKVQLTHFQGGEKNKESRTFIRDCNFSHEQKNFYA